MNMHSIPCILFDRILYSLQQIYSPIMWLYFEWAEFRSFIQFGRLKQPLQQQIWVIMIMKGEWLLIFYCNFQRWGIKNEPPEYYYYSYPSKKVLASGEKKFQSIQKRYDYFNNVKISTWYMLSWIPRHFF